MVCRNIRPWVGLLPLLQLNLVGEHTIYLLSTSHTMFYLEEYSSKPVTQYVGLYMWKGAVRSYS
jgi:hypothetical protein